MCCIYNKVVVNAPKLSLIFFYNSKGWDGSSMESGYKILEVCDETALFFLYISISDKFLEYALREYGNTLSNSEGF